MQRHRVLAIPSRICPSDLKFKLNFFRPGARNGFEFVASFAIVRCICTESSSKWTQINAPSLGRMQLRLPATKYERILSALQAQKKASGYPLA